MREHRQRPLMKKSRSLTVRLLLLLVVRRVVAEEESGFSPKANETQAMQLSSTVLLFGLLHI